LVFRVYYRKKNQQRETYRLCGMVIFLVFQVKKLEKMKPQKNVNERVKIWYIAPWA